MGATIVGTFLDQADRLTDRDAFKVKRGEKWTGITWGEYRDAVRRVGGGLRSLGIDRGDRVALISLNRPEWHIADLGIQSLGGVTVPIYATNSPPQVEYIAAHSESKAIFCENAAQLEKVLQKRGDLPNLLKAILFDAGEPS